jgi:hypothetical protein
MVMAVFFFMGMRVFIAGMVVVMVVRMAMIPFNMAVGMGVSSGNIHAFFLCTSNAH